MQNLLIKKPHISTVRAGGLFLVGDVGFFAGLWHSLS